MSTFKTGRVRLYGWLSMNRGMSRMPKTDIADVALPEGFIIVLKMIEHICIYDICSSMTGNGGIV